MEDILAEEMYFLLPFHLFAHESRFKEYETSDAKLAGLEKEYRLAWDQLEDMCSGGKISSYQKNMLEEMSRKVSEQLTARNGRVKERLGDVMGGKVLEYEAKTIYREGKAEGKTEGGNLMIYRLVQDRDLSPEKGAGILNITVPELKKRMLACGFSIPG